MQLCNAYTRVVYARYLSCLLFQFRKTGNRHDACMIAQEKLHPVCAQRPSEIMISQTSNGAMYHTPPACHLVAELCKEDEECR